MQQETTGHRGRHDPLYRIRRLLRRGAENLSSRAWERLLAGLEAGDVDQQIARTWIAARDLRRIYRSREEFLAYFDTGGVSNGLTEAINLLIEKIKRAGHGFRNFDNYRLRLLLHCGVTWHTPRATRIRGRPPRLAA